MTDSYRAVLFTAAIVTAPVAVVAFLLFKGFLRFNYPSIARFPVRGVDVSHHQGQIDWVKLREQGYVFAFIKATEGGDHRDRLFEENWVAAGREGLARGAYHFFTFCAPGDKQAANFIGAVAPGQPMLAPAVDIEFGGNCKSPPEVPEIRAQLTIFLDRVEAAYSRRPIIYVTSRAYNQIVARRFPSYPLWVRNIFREPRMDDGWVFWQYANRGRVDGVHSFVDLNLFNGSRESFEACLTLEHC